MSQEQVQGQTEAPAAVTQAEQPAAATATATATLQELEKMSLDEIKTGKPGTRLVDQLTDSKLARAKALAAKVGLKNSEELHSVTQKAMDELTSISKDIIGNTKVGEVEGLQEVFRQIEQVGKEIDTSRLSRQPGTVKKLLVKLKLAVDELKEYLKRYQSVQGKIEGYRQALLTVEAARIVAIKTLEALKVKLFEAYEAMEIAIAAAELVHEREINKWAADQKALMAKPAGPTLQELSELKDRRRDILNLDNRLMRYQNSRASVLIHLETINTQISGEEAVKQIVHDLSRQAIPQLFAGCAIGISIYKLRKANELGDKVQEMVIRQQAKNVADLGMAMDEIHFANMKTAERSQTLAGLMDNVLTLVKKGTSQMRENEKANQSARETLAEAERKFKVGLAEDLKDAAGTDAPAAAK